MANSVIDLAFLMDCTSSMNSYIDSAKENINKISDELIRSEKCRLRIALVEYRDHPPQDKTFVTRINDFTDNIAVAKKFISNASASGGGDLPESICCAMYDCLNNLNWSVQDSVKIAILIADAPPHGLAGIFMDGFPKGCPKHNDPVDLAHKMAERAITLYTVGCEPALQSYRDFFQALSLITGGKYVPLDQAKSLPLAIIGGTREEVSMEKLMAQVHNEVMKEAADKGEAVNEDVLTKRIHDLLNSQGSKVNKVVIDDKDVEISEAAKAISKVKTLNEANYYFERNKKGTTKTVKRLPETEKSTPPLFVKASVDEEKKDVEPAAKKMKIDEKTSVAKPPSSSTDSTKPSTKGKELPRKAIRRSTRLAFNTKEDALEYIEKTGGDTDIEDDDEEAKEIPKKKPNLTKAPSSVSISSDDKIDMDQARRLVKKSIARNKLNK